MMAVVNVNVDVNALLDTIINLSREVADSSYIASKARENFILQKNRLESKHEFWQQQITMFGLQSNSALMHAVSQAESLLKRAADPNPPTCKCCSWCKTETVPSPPWTQLEESILLVIKAMDAITDDFKKQEEDRSALFRRTLDRSPSLQFQVDHRYVPLEKMEAAVTEKLALESAENPLVVLLHGGPGKGKSALARNLALRFDAQAKEAATVAKQRSFSPEPSSSNGAVFRASPLFERVIWLECGPQVKLEEAQLKLRAELGWDSSALNQSSNYLYGSKDHVKAPIKSLLKNQTFLIIFDDVDDQQFLQAMVLLCSSRVKCLVTSQHEDFRLHCPLAKVPMEDIEHKDAQRILASHIGLKDQSIPEKTQGLADDIIHKIGANPLAISCIAQAIDRRRVGDSREWEKATEELSDLLGSSSGSQMHGTQYRDSVWGALQLAFEKLTKQERNLLVLVSMCEGPSVPEEVFEFLYERVKIPNSSSKFQASRTQLEMRQHIVISGEQQRSWRIHSLLDRFINEKKKDDKTTMFNVFYGLSTTESATISQDGVGDADVVNVLGALYFNEEYAEKFVKKMVASLNEFSNVRRNVIEPVTRLLVLKGSSNSEWTALLADCVKQTFMKYIHEGVFNEENVLTLLMSPTSTIAILQVLDQITSKGSQETSLSPKCIRKILKGLFKILGNVFRKGEKRDHAFTDRNLLIRHVRALIPKLWQKGDLQDHISLIFVDNFRLLEELMNTLAIQEDRSLQAEAAIILGSIASAHVEIAFEMANFRGLLRGLYNAITSVDHHNFELQLYALEVLDYIGSGSFLAYDDIRISVGNSVFSDILKELVRISCESKYPQLQNLALSTISNLSHAAFLCEDEESITIIRSTRGLFEGFFNLLAQNNVSTEIDLVAGTLAFVDPEKSKELHLSSASEFLARGFALAVLGHYKDSIEDLQKAFGGKKFSKARASCTMLYAKVKLEDLQGALADADSWINIDPEDQMLFQERGVLKRMMGDLDGALMDLNSSLKLDGDDYESLKHRGYVKYLKRDEEGAREDAKHALSVKPRRVDGRGYLRVGGECTLQAAAYRKTNYLQSFQGTHLFYSRYSRLVPDNENFLTSIRTSIRHAEWQKSFYKCCGPYDN